MNYGRLPLFPPACGAQNSLCMPLFERCGCAGASEACQCVQIQNPACPGEYAEVELCVDSCGNLSICVRRPPAPLLSAAQKAQAAMRLRPLPALLERTCIPKRRVSKGPPRLLRGGGWRAPKQTRSMRAESEGVEWGKGGGRDLTELSCRRVDGEDGERDPLPA